MPRRSGRSPAPSGLSRMTAGSTALVGLVNPVVGTALGVVVMHEAFGPAQLLGVVLVLGGVLAGQPAAVSALRRQVRGRLVEPRRAQSRAQKASTLSVGPETMSSSVP